MKKEIVLFTVLACVFVANVILAEFIGVKIFSLDASLGMRSIEYSLFQIPMNLSYTAGVIIWPIVFVLTDIINDYYGKKGVKFLTYLALTISIYAFVIVKIAINLEPASWWTGLHVDKGIPDFNLAYQFVFGQGNNIIIASLTAFVIGQIVDVTVFQQIKKRSKGNKLWVRATISTLISQLIDSYVVIFVAFYYLQDWKFDQAFSVSLNNYIYKGIVAILMIPVLHFMHRMIEKYLGKERSEEMRSESMVS